MEWDRLRKCDYRKHGVTRVALNKRIHPSLGYLTMVELFQQVDVIGLSGLVPTVDAFDHQLAH
jgi:hypothetical protein